MREDSVRATPESRHRPRAVETAGGKLAYCRFEVALSELQQRPAGELLDAPVGNHPLGGPIESGIAAITLRHAQVLVVKHAVDGRLEHERPRPCMAAIDVEGPLDDPLAGARCHQP